MGKQGMCTGNGRPPRLPISPSRAAGLPPVTLCVATRDPAALDPGSTRIVDLDTLTHPRDISPGEAGAAR
jgi:hypothetical protein